MFSKKKQSEDALRRAWFSGIRKSDVERTIDRLESRNDELQTELRQAELTAGELTNRLKTAESTLEVFDASIRNMGTILELAERHASEIEDNARAEADRLRTEADEHSRAVAAEVDALLARRREALDSIGTLLSGLSEITGDPDQEPVAEPVTEEHVAELVPLHTPVTVADLMAMEPNLGF